MGAEGYGQHVQMQIQDWPPGEPITAAAVAANLAVAFGIGIEKAKKVTNVNMKRLVDKGKLAHVQKGVYGKVKATPFGRLEPNTDEIITGLLLREGANVIGYIVGPTLLNAVGLCSWLPKERHIATNNYRRQIPAGASIRVYKPVIPVNDENAPYLEAIEAFAALDRYPIDAEKPDEILRGILRSSQIDNEKLIWYARNHYGNTTLLKTIDIALGGYNIEASQRS